MKKLWITPEPHNPRSGTGGWWVFVCIFAALGIWLFLPPHHTPATQPRAEPVVEQYDWVQTIDYPTILNAGLIKILFIDTRDSYGITHRIATRCHGHYWEGQPDFIPDPVPRAIMGEPLRAVGSHYAGAYHRACIRARGTELPYVEDEHPRGPE